MGFALGEVFNAGDQGNGMILFDVRSAPRVTLVKADFDYSQELMVRCAMLGQMPSEAGGTRKFAIQLLPGPDIGEKAYVIRQFFNGNITGVGLRVLAGTVSLDMGSNTGMAISEEEAVSVMTQIAQEFVAAVKRQ
ncbi:hypothetical protein NMQ03_11320 [Arthrobacter sp. DNA4]|uniref:hypothetical protein n=1 Tax=Arthrobacter sp. DNA4 TaxID=2963432 RepID=UPI0020CC1313|nr:hypothetical protein [Arthrobacter sp. DNA4]UTT67904.1 hypothetical protein NMQ03_11320 [Arthrobacter sp. DNA4]